MKRKCQTTMHTNDKGGFISTSPCWLSVLVPNAVELEWHLKLLNVISSDVIWLNIKRDRTKIGLLL